MNQFSIRQVVLLLSLLLSPVVNFCLFAQSVVPTDDKVYRIAWHNNRGLFITESDEGSLIVSERNNASKQFWTLIPVEGKADVYYVRNTATKHYIASCNLTLGISLRPIVTTTTSRPTVRAV